MGAEMKQDGAGIPDLEAEVAAAEDLLNETNGKLRSARDRLRAAQAVSGEVELTYEQVALYTRMLVGRLLDVELSGLGSYKGSLYVVGEEDGTLTLDFWPVESQGEYAHMSLSITQDGFVSARSADGSVSVCLTGGDFTLEPR